VNRHVARALVLLLLAPLPALPAGPAHAQPSPSVVPGTTTVVAGDGDGDGGAATGALIGQASALAYAPDGDLLAAANVLRRVDAATGLVSTVPVTAFGSLRDVAAGADGSVYVVDQSRVLRVGGDGTTTVLVSGVDPTGVTVAPDGDVVYAVDLDGVGEVLRISGGTTTRIAGGPGAATPLGNVLDLEFTADGDLLILDANWWRLRRLAGGEAGGAMDVVAGREPGFGVVEDGQAPTSGTLVASDVAVAADGDVVVAALFGTLRRFAIGGTVSTVDTGGVACSWPVATRADGMVTALCDDPWQYANVPGDGTLVTVLGGTRAADGTPAAEAWFGTLRDAATGQDGTVYLLDGTDLRTLSGGVLDTAATGLSAARRVAVAPDDGTVYVSSGEHLHRVTGGGSVPYSATSFGEIHALAAGEDGDVYVLPRYGCAAYRVDDAGVAHAIALPECAAFPGGIALTPDGRLVHSRGGVLYVADGGGVLRRVEPGWSAAVAVTADGTIHGTDLLLRPDGTRETQEYPVPPSIGHWERLFAEAGGTLLTTDASRVLRDRKSGR
jgi:hypothetical protein